VPVLTAPVWGRQPEETPKAHAAFLAWLMGGVHVRDWSAATRAAEMSLEHVRTLAQRWVWEARAREWLAAERSARADAFQVPAIRDELAALVAVRLRAHRAALELEALELEKTLAKARGETVQGPAALPTTLDPRELAAIRRVNVQASDALRREAEGLPVVDDGVRATAFDKLSAEELEDYRRLRSKAGAG
jgi:hypothetical protein